MKEIKSGQAKSIAAVSRACRSQGTVRVTSCGLTAFVAMSEITYARLLERLATSDAFMIPATETLPNDPRAILAAMEGDEGIIETRPARARRYPSNVIRLRNRK